MEQTETETLNNLYELYKTSKLQADEHKDDVSEEEKKLRYATLISKLEAEFLKQEKDSESFIKLLSMLSSIYYEQARLLVANENVHISFENLYKAIELTTSYRTNPQITYIYLRIINHYSYLLSKQGSFEEAKNLLENAEIFYNEQIPPKDSILIYNTDEIFHLTSEKNVQNSTKLDKLVTNNLQMLGWIYNKQNNQDKFVFYHHEVLRRQLEMQDGNALTWVLKCARLSSYFLSKQRFREARHHLAAALVVLQEYERDLREYQTDPNFLAEWEELQHHYADVARYWVKYGLFLFSASRSHNMNMYYTTSQALDEMIFGKDDIEPQTDDSKDRIVEIPSTENEPNEEIKSHKEDIELKENNEKDVKEVESVEKENEDEKEKNVNEILNEQDILKDNKNTKDEQIVVKNEQSIENADKEEEKAKEQVVKEEQEIAKDEVNKINDDEQQCGDKINSEKTDNGGNTIHCKEEGNGDTKNEVEPMEICEQTDEDEFNTNSINDDLLLFPSLNLIEIEGQVTSEYIMTTEQARSLFLFSQAWLRRSKQFYTVHDYTLDYVNSILDLSELYRYLAFYEIDIESQYNVQKRRADVLETLSTILRDVRPQCYVAVSIELLRELAEVQIELLALNMQKLYYSDPTAASQSFPIVQDMNTRKMEAFSDIHNRLESFNDRLNPNRMASQTQPAMRNA